MPSNHVRSRTIVIALVVTSACGLRCHPVGTTPQGDGKATTPNATPAPSAWSAVARALGPQSAAPVPAIATPTAVGSGPSAVRSPALRRTDLHSPLPGGQMAGYAGDTGLDIAGLHLPVFAMASGTLDYSERGHTVWTGAHDTPLSVRIELDAPIEYGTHRITHAYYTHLSKLRFARAEGSAAAKIHVEAGECLGVSGLGNGLPHLHLGLLLDGDVSQTTWATIVREDAIRTLLGKYRLGETLPNLSKEDAIVAARVCGD